MSSTVNKSPKKMILMLGSGGVGKTTTAAALGLSLVNQKGQLQKGALFTIDPSKRLCQTLGLQRLSLEASYLCDGRLEAYGLETHEALKRLLKKVIKDDARVEKIVNHRLFQIIEGNISHLDHFIAIDKVVELLDREDLDFIVVDTPPHDQAFEFFESPRVLSSFLDKSFLRILLDPSSANDGFFNRVFNKAIEEGWKLFKGLFGEGFWDELAVLLKELLPLRERLLYSAERLSSALKDSQTQAILVTVPEERPLEIAQALAQDWNTKMNVAFSGVILNRSFADQLVFPELLSNTLLYQRWQKQLELMKLDWLQKMPLQLRLDPVAPKQLNIQKLEEMGHDITQKFFAH